ncbi:MAG: Fe-S cluster assembly protein SufD [Alphaproteobacteria bacterium]
MNIHNAIAPTATEREIARTYKARRDDLPGGAGLARLRDAAFSRLQDVGLPHRRHEPWHYTDLRRLLKLEPGAPTAAGVPGVKQVMAAGGAGAFAAMAPARMVFVDGRFAADLSDLEGLGEGVVVSPLSQGDLPEWALGEIAARRPEGDNAIFDLNIALAQDGAIIQVAANTTPSRALHILSFGAHADIWSVLRHVIVVAPGASLTLIETHGGAASLSSVATSINAGAGARVSHVKVQDLDHQATHLAPMVVELGEKVTFDSFTLSLGAGLAREERHVRFTGALTQGNISGAYVLAGRQHCDTTLVVDHVGQGCTARELFKAILNDQAHGVFQGALNVAASAQQTDARQSVDVLLLSDEAAHDAKPELAIYADDVQCGHGATTGELNAEQLFYLQSRGIGRPQAEALLISAFIAGGIEVIANEDLRDAVKTIATRHLEVGHA